MLCDRKEVTFLSGPQFLCEMSFVASFPSLSLSLSPWSSLPPPYLSPLPQVSLSAPLPYRPTTDSLWSSELSWGIHFCSRCRRGSQEQEKVPALGMNILRRVRACVLSHFNHVPLYMTPWTVACQAPLSMGILQERMMERVACPPAGDPPNPRMEPRSPALQADSLPAEPPGKSESEVTQLCPTLCNPMDPPPMEFPRQEYWRAAISFFRGSY